ncbi:hypothetical protein RHS01_00042 [Rhizoctonia solani]|uniref:RNA-directed DNA polymerase n=1 Tax=Rhizoctonia solani TaxID=456999 RepID=A0A8H7IM93_9AGAM|nr:hypothetical protein RHS01_00042 [Rhizoctonia solani]
MLDGTISQTGRIWHQVQLAVLVNDHPHTIPFLVCPIGNTPAILGMTWLTAESPLIDWQQGLVTFPEQVQIASEEEADSDPLADLPTEYHKFSRVFGKEEFKVLPPHREYDIAIDLLPNAKLSPGPIYGMTDAESKALKQHINEELATGKIRPSTSSTGAPVIKLNEVTHKNVYPLPRQDDLMAKLRHAKIFTKLDLRWGYNNVRIKEGDEWKTAFRTKYGLFEYLVMPFGLTNAPAAQHPHLLGENQRPSGPCQRGTIRLMKNQLFCKLLKCHFHVTTVDYLGIVISPDGFSMDQKKIEAVTSWPTPRTVKQVQAFLGFVNYLRRFIPNFSSVARPLHNLTKKETPWSWGNLEEVAFQELKSLVTRSPALIHSNPDLPYYLETDALGVAMGAILRAKANYDTHDKELLAIIKALEEWRIFLEATNKPIQVFTDHRNLEYWMQARTFNRRHARWRIFLSNFNFEIHYCPGKQSGKPDALSRRLDYIDMTPGPEVMLPAEVFANTSEEELEIFLTEDADNTPPSICKAYRDYDWEEDLLWYRGKLVVPDSETLKEQLLKEFHDSPLAGHPGQQRTLELLSRNYWWPGMKSSAKEWFGHFIPTSKKVTAKGLADLFIAHVWKLHGLPVKTISDRGTTFTGKFLRALYQRLRVRPAFSSAYHPESDGQTERVNQFIEYAYNNAKHAATGKSPFELVYGRNPVMNPSNVPANVPEADTVADTLAREWKEAESAPNE